MKRNRRFRRHTVKKTKYGGMLRAAAAAAEKPKSTMNPAAKEYVPMARRETVEEPELAPAPAPIFNEATMYKMFLFSQAPTSVAIDCEMVGVGYEGKRSALAHVAIVDFDGNKIYEKYVMPKEPITNYRFKWSGITENKLKAAEPFDKVKAEVHDILSNRLIVGHGLDSDFHHDVLDFSTAPILIWDTAKLPEYTRPLPPGAPPGTRPQAYKLKDLAMTIGNNIQKNDGKGHSPLEDARAAMNLFRTYLGFPKVDYAAAGRNMRTSD